MLEFLRTLKKKKSNYFKIQFFWFEEALRVTESLEI